MLTPSAITTWVKYLSTFFSGDNFIDFQTRTHKRTHTVLIRGVSEKLQGFMCCVSYELGRDYRGASPCDVISGKYITAISALCSHCMSFFFHVLLLTTPQF